MTRLLAIAAFLLPLVAPSVVGAQGPYSLPPGPPTPCRVYLPVPSCDASVFDHDFDFANVFLAVEGYEHTFISIKNKADVASLVVLEVTVTNRPPVRYVMALTPQQRPEPVRLNDWPELKDVHTGVSVVVLSTEPLSATVAMHPGDVRTFWTGARILEGR